MSNYETNTERLKRKAKDAPFMIAGIAGLMGVVGYGIYGFRKRQLKTSVYLIHMRVVAQGFVVLCLTAGVTFNIYNEQVYPWLYPASIEDKKKE